jgi:hypothetical protein
MENLLNSHSALHNFKQAHGLNIADANSVSAYVLERRLMRILNAEITHKTVRELAKRVGLSIAEIEDIVEGKVYDLEEDALLGAIETYESSGIAACLKYIDEI